MRIFKLVSSSITLQRSDHLPIHLSLDDRDRHLAHLLVSNDARVAVTAVIRRATQIHVEGVHASAARFHQHFLERCVELLATIHWPYK